MIVHRHGYRIAASASGGFSFTRDDGAIVPASPELPRADGDIAACHDAEITSATIIPIGLGDHLDLDLAVWGFFANARVAQERLSGQP